MNLYEIYYLIFRNKWFILGGVAAGLVAASIMALASPPHFRSEALLLVRYVTDTVISGPSVTGEDVVVPGRTADSVISTEMEILSSADLIASAVAALSAQPEFKGVTNSFVKAITTRQVARNFHIRSTKEGNTLGIYFDGPTAQFAQNVLQQLIDAYLIKHQEVHKDAGVLEFIARQTDEMRGRLNDTEDELRRLKAQAGIVSFADARLAAATRLEEMDRAIRDAESRLAGLDGVVQNLSPQFANSHDITNIVPDIATQTDAATPMDPAMASTTAEAHELLRNLVHLYGRESSLLATYTTNSVPVRDVRAQILSLEDKLTALQPEAITRLPTNSIIDRPFHTGGQPETMIATMDGARAEAAALTAQLRVLRIQQAKAKEDSQKLESFEAQMTRLERTKKIYETNYLYFSQRQEQARIEGARDASKVSNIAIIQAPTRPAVPLHENLPKQLLMVFAIFASLGIGAAGVREFLLDHTLRHPQRIQRLLEIPMIATIPRLKHIAAAAGFGSITAQVPDENQNQERAAAAACELVAQLILRLEPPRNGPLIVGFSAPHRGAGVSLIASQVANSTYLSGVKRVLLVKVTDAGTMTASEIRASGTPHRDALPKQGTDQTPVDMSEMEEQVPVEVSILLPVRVTPGKITEFSKGAYDCILLDLPPITTSRTGMRLVPSLNGLVLILEASRTTLTEAQLSMNLLRQLACHPIGAILNKFTSPIPDWLMPQQNITDPSPVSFQPKARHATQ